MTRRRAPADEPHPPVDWSALQYQPAPNTPVLRCRCGGAYVDDEPSRAAHVAVFGHSPRTPEPAKPPKETTP